MCTTIAAAATARLILKSNNNSPHPSAFKRQEIENVFFFVSLSRIEFLSIEWICEFSILGNSDSHTNSLETEKLNGLSVLTRMNAQRESKIENQSKGQTIHLMITFIKKKITIFIPLNMLNKCTVDST